MKKQLYPLVLCLGLMAFVSSCEDAQEELADPLATDYLLYSIFLESEYVGYEDIVLHAESYYGLVYFGLYENRTENYKTRYPEIPEDMLDALDAVYQDSIYYEDQFLSLDKDLLIQKSEAFNEAMGVTDGPQEFWDKFLALYGENAGRVSLSRVAYNDNEDEALFAATTFMRSGFGYLVHMVKTNNVWTIENVANIFVIN